MSAAVVVLCLVGLGSAPAEARQTVVPHPGFYTGEVTSPRPGVEVEFRYSAARGVHDLRLRQISRWHAFHGDVAVSNGHWHVCQGEYCVTGTWHEGRAVTLKVAAAYVVPVTWHLTARNLGG